MEIAKDWRLGILGIYAVAVGAIQIWAGKPDDLESAIWITGFWAFAVLPIALLCLSTHHILIKGVAAIIVAAYGLYAYTDSMFGLFGAKPTSTSALIFIFLPIYQLAAALALLALLWIIRFEWKERR